MSVITLEELKQIKKTEIIELSNFEGNGNIEVEVKRPNMMHLIAAGEIPNTLLSVAMDMFNGKTGDLASNATKSANNLKQMVEMMLVLADKCLVSPTCKQLKELDIQLTEQQLMEILTYTQGGVKALENFRKQ